MRDCTGRGTDRLLYGCWGEEGKDKQTTVTFEFYPLHPNFAAPLESQDNNDLEASSFGAHLFSSGQLFGECLELLPWALKVCAGCSGVCDTGERGSVSPDILGFYVLREAISQGIFS